MTKNISAYTSTEIHYPQFFNVSEDGDDVVIIMRQPAKFDELKGYVVCGVTTSIKITKEDWQGISNQIALYTLNKMLDK